jgi:N-acetylmuramoyl-L-alanine amidase
MGMIANPSWLILSLVSIDPISLWTGPQRGPLLYSYHLMRRVYSISLLVLILLSPLVVGAHDDLLIETRKGRYRVQALRYHERDYYSLSRLTAATECQLSLKQETAVITGPSGTLQLTDGRALVRFNSDYILLSTAPWKAQPDDWYVAEDFIARALSLVLEDSLQRAGLRHYRTGSVSVEIDIELINRPDQVRLIIRSRQNMPVSILEYSDRLEVALGAAEVGVQFPPIRPNPEIVAAFSEVDGLLIIHKGPRYERFEESQSDLGTAFTIDFFGIPSTIVRLPLRSSTRSAPTDAAADVPGEVESPTQFDQLQDYRSGPISRRAASVVIDPGHGGADSGLVWDSLLEKNIALEVAFRIQSILETADYSCQLTRTRDVSLPIEKRSGVANYYQPRAFVSIHVGGAPAAATRSMIVYVSDRSQTTTAKTEKKAQLNLSQDFVAWGEGQDPYTSQSKLLGSLIRQRLGAVSKVETVIVGAPLAVLEAIRAPAVLIELGHLTNTSQRAELQSKHYQGLIAEAIAQSILSFIATQEGDSQPY